MFLKIKKLPLNALNWIYCKFHIAQIIIIEDINNIIKGALEVFISVFSKTKYYLRYFKLMKGKALRKHSLHEKTAASVLLKLFISSNE